MKILKSLPPNFEEIGKYFPLDLPEFLPIFTYGDTIYCPHTSEIPADIEKHEEIHMIQQGTQPDLWWKKWIADPDFRLRQELEAYAVQYLFVRVHLGAKAGDACLEETARSLSSPVYQLPIDQYHAKKAIRKLAGSMA